MKPLTPKQQERETQKAIARLLAMGFVKAETPPWPVHYRLDLGNDRPQICIRPGSLGRGWNWQIAKRDEQPSFGMSGSMAIGEMWATADRVVADTLGYIWNKGHDAGWQAHKDRQRPLVEKLKSLACELATGVSSV